MKRARSARTTPPRAAPPIVLYTDFGAGDIYAGQMKGVLVEQAPAVPILDLTHQAPKFDVEAAAHLLAALQHRFAAGSVFVAVVDPGVGTARGAVIVEADDRWFVGPDNGLLSVVAQRAARTRAWAIVWRPAQLSTSFHGRDLFAPIAAAIARGDFPRERVETLAALAVGLPADDLAAVVYVDDYGNALTGLRARNLARDAVVAVGARGLRFADVFGSVAAGEPFWYENSVGLVEIAANRASAAALLQIHVGDRVAVIR